MTRNHPEVLSIRANIFTSHSVVSTTFLAEDDTPAKTKSSRFLQATNSKGRHEAISIDEEERRGSSEEGPSDSQPRTHQRRKTEPQQFTIEDLSTATDSVGNHISSRGFFWTYLGGLIVLVLGSGIAIGIGDATKYGLPETYGAQVAVVFAVVWWAIFLIPVARDLKPRPGPPLPRSENFLFYSVKKVAHTISKCRRLKNLFMFLIGWFIYSDSFSTLISVAILYAQTEIRMSTVSLLILVIIVVIVAGIGCIVWDKLQRTLNISTKKILLIQSISHLMHFTLTCVPKVITDKGSSWIGPLVVAAMDDYTHNKRLAFIFILVMMILPLFFFARVNVTEGKKEAIEFLKDEELRQQKKAVNIAMTSLKSVRL
ncbi:Autophagy protein 22 [Dinochytrium kinnereticum]|nr:Autophagy protein 22 [Dinochytrium kinnereticum]